MRMGLGDSEVKMARCVYSFRGVTVVAVMDTASVRFVQVELVVYESAFSRLERVDVKLSVLLLLLLASRHIHALPVLPTEKNHRCHLPRWRR